MNACVGRGRSLLISLMWRQTAAWRARALPGPLRAPEASFAVPPQALVAICAEVFEALSSTPMPKGGSWAEKRAR